jgi:hypothetical protein
MNQMRRMVYPNKFNNLRITSDLALDASYYQQFNDSDISNIGIYDTPNAKYKSQIWYSPVNHPQLPHTNIKVINRSVTGKNLIGNQSINNRPFYSSVERTYDKMSASGSTQYNNSMFKSKQFHENTLREKPSTSISKTLPKIPQNKTSKAFVHTAGGTSKKPYRENKNFGLTSLSPFRKSVNLLDPPNQYQTQNRNIINREKVQFRNMNNVTSTDPNTTLYNKDDRFIYIIPEASNILKCTNLNFYLFNLP